MKILLASQCISTLIYISPTQFLKCTIHSKHNNLILILIISLYANDVMSCYVYVRPMLCYVMLYYVMLCYVMLCYVMLCIGGDLAPSLGGRKTFFAEQIFQ